MIRRCVLLAVPLLLDAAAVAAAAPSDTTPLPTNVTTTTTTVAAVVAAPVTGGPMTATLVQSYFSTAATQLVVVLEVTATELITTNGRSAVYVGPDGQQVEAFDAIEPDEVFPGATALVVLVFPAATPGGSVMFDAYTDDYDDAAVAVPVPIA